LVAWSGKGRPGTWGAALPEGLGDQEMEGALATGRWQKEENRSSPGTLELEKAQYAVVLGERAWMSERRADSRAEMNERERRQEGKKERDPGELTTRQRGVRSKRIVKQGDICDSM
jgi:hypothetical protein